MENPGGRLGALINELGRQAARHSRNNALQAKREADPSYDHGRKYMKLRHGGKVVQVPTGYRVAPGQPPTRTAARAKASTRAQRARRDSVAMKGASNG